MKSTLDINILSRLSTIAGITYPMPEKYNEWNTFTKFFWMFYVKVIQATFMIEICSLMVRISRSPDDLGIFCACFVGAGYALHLVLKLCIFNRYHALFIRLFDEMRNISKELQVNPYDEGYVKFYNNYYEKIVKTALVKGGIEVTATVTLIVIFMVRSYIVGVPEDLTTPALSWTPYDNSQNPAYSLTCMFEMIVYGSVTLRNAVLDLLFWLMLMVPTIQLRYLYCLLEIILRDDFTTDENGAVMAGDEKDLNSEFIWWVKYHQRILSMIQEFRTITSPYLGVNYLTTLLLLSLAGLVAISTTSWNIFQQAIINGIVISNTMQLYLVSLAGDWLSESSEHAGEGGFTSVLFTGDKTLRKNYLFVCARTKHSLQIRFGGINTLCSETFEQLIRLTITYLVTIVQLRNEET